MNHSEILSKPMKDSSISIEVGILGDAQVRAERPGLGNNLAEKTVDST
jgi:hypothetical protein